MQPIDNEVINAIPVAAGEVNLDDIVYFLDHDDKKLISMRIEGYNAAEIAAAMNISRDAVYQRTHRIIERLKEEQYGKQ